MCVDEGLIPRVDVLVLDLGDIGEGSTSIGASEVFQSRGVVVVFSLQLSLDLGEDALQVDRGLGGCDVG